MEYSAGTLMALRRVSHAQGMAKRRHFISQWRRHRGLSQVKLAEQIGITQGQLSKVESHKKPYDEDLLGLIAEALRCEVVDLLIRDPSQPESIWSIWESLQPVERKQVVEVAKVIKGTGTGG